MSRWKTEAHFASWLGLCPDNRISRDKVLSRGRRHVVNRAATALRIAATTLLRSQTYLGGSTDACAPSSVPRKLSRPCQVSGEQFRNQGRVDSEENLITLLYRMPFVGASRFRLKESVDAAADTPIGSGSRATTCNLAGSELLCSCLGHARPRNPRRNGLLCRRQACQHLCRK